MREEQIIQSKKVDLILEMVQHILTITSELIGEEEESYERDEDSYEVTSKKKVKRDLAKSSNCIEIDMQ